MFKTLRRFIRRFRTVWRAARRDDANPPVKLYDMYYADDSWVSNIHLGGERFLSVPAGSRLEVYLTPPDPDPAPAPSRHW